MAFVVDSSIVIAWMRDSQADRASRAAFTRAHRETLHAPAIWPFECLNTLLVLERRRRIASHQVSAIVARLRRLGVQTESQPPEPTRLLEIARETGLSIYDASYFEIAERRGLPLATKDARLLGAARRGGIALV